MKQLIKLWPFRLRALFYLHEVPRLVKFRGEECRAVVASGWEELETESGCFVDTEFQFCRMKGAQETDGGDVCTKCDILRATEKWLGW